MPRSSWQNSMRPQRDISRGRADTAEAAIGNALQGSLGAASMTRALHRIVRPTPRTCPRASRMISRYTGRAPTEREMLTCPNAPLLQPVHRAFCPGQAAEMVSHYMGAPHQAPRSPSRCGNAHVKAQARTGLCMTVSHQVDDSPECCAVHERYKDVLQRPGGRL